MNVYLLYVVYVIKTVATVPPNGQCCLWQLRFQDQTKQTLCEYVLIQCHAIYIFTGNVDVKASVNTPRLREVSKNRILSLN